MKCYELNEFIENLEKLNPVKRYKTCSKGRLDTYKKYWNVACAFDTETSNIIDANGEHVHTYAMMISISNDVEVLLRTWDDTVKAFENISRVFEGAKLPIYVHNLCFDFSSFSKWIKFDNIFSVAAHKPIRAESGNIEFRDSAILLACSLAKASEGLEITKAVGDLDYSKIRHSNTELTEREEFYCFSDVECLVEIIKGKMTEHNLARIPMTYTGYVREYVRNEMRKNKIAMQFVQNLKINSAEEYELLKNAFMGGFSHTNAGYFEEIMENVTSYDICSSYPTVLAMEKFPCSTGKRVNVKNSMKEFIYYMTNYLCIFPVVFYNIRAKKKAGDCPIAIRSCNWVEGIEADNGKVYKAEKLVITLTNIDFEIIQDFYKFDKISVDTIYYYKASYLPKPIVESIIELYNAKTTLKGIAGKEGEYNRSKSLLNAIFGMMVTDPSQPLIKYEDGEWNEEENNDFIEKYNNNKNRFLFYPWGVFCTAYARRNLFDAILETGEDHVYSDTDSEKFINGEKHKEFFDNYNKRIMDRLKEVAKHYRIPEEKLMPKTSKGIVKPLGAFEYEYCYKYFKSLGCKRYLAVTEDNEVIFTVAGAEKSGGAKYLMKISGVKYEEINGKLYVKGNAIDMFDKFNDELVIPEEYSGRVIHKYICLDEEFEVTDYKGETIKVREKGGCFLQPSPYSLSVDDEYIRFALMMKSVRSSYK